MSPNFYKSMKRSFWTLTLRTTRASDGAPVFPTVVVQSRWAEDASKGLSPKLFAVNSHLVCVRLLPSSPLTIDLVVSKLLDVNNVCCMLQDIAQQYRIVYSIAYSRPFEYVGISHNAEPHHPACIAKHPSLV